MTERLILTLVIVAAALLAYQVSQRLRLGRSGTRALRLRAYRPGRPAILFFSGEGCASCHTIQRPALEDLEAEYGGVLQVIEVDALAEPELADHWGVLSLPTTFVIDRHGRPRRVNHAPARADRLRAQLTEIGEAAAGHAAELGRERSERMLD
jgi:thiol-disulfide isomerase/thioredoxin